MRTRCEPLPAPEQLALDLPAPPIRGGAAVILADSNRDAAAFASRPELWPTPIACLVGPAGCGKTCIAHACFTSAIPLTAETLQGDGPVAALSSAGAAGRFCCDDLDAAHRAALAAGGDRAQRLEAGLFHLINELAVGGGRLLVCAVEPPALWPVALPDLRTRLNAALLLRIAPPEDALLEAYLERRLQERGLVTGVGVARFLLQRIERSFAAVEAALERLDRAGLKEQRRITRDLAARALGL